MSTTVLQLASLSAKIALLGGIAWTQLYILRRASAKMRALVCTLALISIVIFAAAEFPARPQWMPAGVVFRVSSTNTVSVASAGLHLNPTSSLLLIWALGSAFLVARAVAGRWALARLRRRSTLDDRFGGLDVRIAEVETPILVGVVRPVILVPKSAADWSVEQRRMVLTHELTHFTQGDCWRNLFAQLLRAALWFHPVVWMLVARLSREQELACDEAVVASGHSPHDYAAFLLDAVRRLRSQDIFACAMAGSGAVSMKQRFANLLDTRVRSLSRIAAVSMAFLALLTAALVVVRPVWSQDTDGAYRVGNGVLAPKVLYKVNPEYTQEDRDAKISGTVILKMVVTADGKANRITVVKPLSPGLDQKAIEALQKWEFQPGVKDGKPVPVWATIEVNFRLQ